MLAHSKINSILLIPTRTAILAVFFCLKNYKIIKIINFYIFSHLLSHFSVTSQSPPHVKIAPRFRKNYRSLKVTTTKHLNQRELAERWNISPSTLERWRVLGGGPTYLKIGGRVVYRQEDINNYEQDCLHCKTSTKQPDQVA
jgi:hypothetical protein